MNSESQDTLFEDIGSQVSSIICIPNERINSRASSLILLWDVNSIRFLNLDTVLKNQIPKKFTYVLQLELHGIRAVNFEWNGVNSLF